MTNIIIILLVVVILACALKGTLKHFKGESSCCGGGSGTVKTKSEKKKLSGPVIGKKTIKISGMHCEHCVQSVTKAINKIEGASAKVDLKKETAVISYDRELDEAVFVQAIEQAGFQVVAVEA